MKISPMTTPTLKSRIFKYLAFCFLAIVTLYGCDGGISGTGDGGPVIIDPAPETGVDSSPGEDTVNGQDISNSTDSMENPAPTPDVSQLLPDALQQLNTREDNASSAQNLATHLEALQREIDSTLQDTNAVTGTPEDNFNESFDTTLRYMLNDTETVIARGLNANPNADPDADMNAATGYLFSTNRERVIHVLQQSDTLTVRYLNRGTNSLLQASIFILPDGITVIEADLNENGSQSYFNTLSGEVTTVFIQHPTDTAIARQRELIDGSGNILIQQSCTAASQDCALDTNWSNADASFNSQFSTALSIIDTSRSSITSPVTELPDTVNEAVLTQSSNENPTEELILCGLQRTTDTVRSFCLRPEPFGQTSLFSESLAGSDVFYQLLE